MDEPLRTRHQEILHSVVRAFIETGEPVGSRTISRRRDDELSPASIRNAMADLADDGYLSQPHTSAGRVPTEKAFRHYVRSLTAGRIASFEAERLRQEFSTLDTIGARIEMSSRILMELTRNVGIALAIPALFLGLHAAVSLIQAYVFMLLAMIYLSQAVAHEHGEGAASH